MSQEPENPIESLFQAVVTEDVYSDAFKNTSGIANMISYKESLDYWEKEKETLAREGSSPSGHTENFIKTECDYFKDRFEESLAKLPLGIKNTLEYNVSQGDPSLILRDTGPESRPLPEQLQYVLQGIWHGTIPGSKNAKRSLQRIFNNLKKSYAVPDELFPKLKNQIKDIPSFYNDTEPQARTNRLANRIGRSR